MGFALEDSRNNTNRANQTQNAVRAPHVHTHPPAYTIPFDLEVRAADKEERIGFGYSKSTLNGKFYQFKICLHIPYLSIEN